MSKDKDKLNDIVRAKANNIVATIDTQKPVTNNLYTTPTRTQELSHPLQNESLEPEESNKNAIEVIDTILKYKQIEKDGGLKTLSLEKRVEYGDAIKDLKYFQEDHFNENPEAKAASEVLISLLDKDLNTLARKLDSKSNNPSNDKSSQKEQSKYLVYNVLLNTPLEA